MHALTLASLLPSWSKKSPATRRPDRQMEADRRKAWPLAAPAQDVVVVVLADRAGRLAHPTTTVLDMERRHCYSPTVLYMYVDGRICDVRIIRTCDDVRITQCKLQQ